MITIFDLLRYWAGYNIHQDLSWIDRIEHLLICKTNKNADRICKHFS